jgi:hypothetical protein
VLENVVIVRHVVGKAICPDVFYLLFRQRHEVVEGAITSFIVAILGNSHQAAIGRCCVFLFLHTIVCGTRRTPGHERARATRRFSV